MRQILCLSGPNLDRLGKREPDIYGSTTLREIHASLKQQGRARGYGVVCKQSNHEGDLCTWIGEAEDRYLGLLINAGALTHTSIALLDAVRGVRVPCIEVHLSNPTAREPFRRRSYIGRGAAAVVSGFGPESYTLALDGLMRLLERSRVTNA